MAPLNSPLAPLSPCTVRTRADTASFSSHSAPPSPPPSQIYRLDGGNWTQTPGNATSITVGSAQNVWVVGMDRQPYQWDGGNWTQRRAPQGITKLSASAGGKVCAVTESGAVLGWTGGEWVVIAGVLKNVGIHDHMIVGANPGGEIYALPGL